MIRKPLANAARPSGYGVKLLLYVSAPLTIFANSSAVSVAQDADLRRSIRNSIEQQLDLLDNIGTAQMENEIVKNILAVTRKQSMQSAEQTGVGSSLEEGDIREYLVQVVKETKEIKNKTKNDGL
jgi:hypothetical protein